ncbi:MAG: hypothetical protein QXK65_02720 [Candidatus Micrarchaeaceae archaeon]
MRGKEIGRNKVGEMSKIEMGDERRVAKGINEEKIRNKMISILKGSDFTEVFESGDIKVDGAAGAAMRAILSEKAAEYVTKAIKIAKKRRMKFGAAAIIIATRKEEKE